VIAVSMRETPPEMKKAAEVSLGGLAETLSVFVPSQPSRRADSRYRSSSSSNLPLSGDRYNRQTNVRDRPQTRLLSQGVMVDERST
jgi:hypothetical protein